MRRRIRSGSDSGFTLVELLVAMVVFSMLGGILMSTVVGSAETAKTTKQSTDINEEARLALNRMSRELRQASDIQAASSPDGKTSITFEVDFNGNLSIEPSAADPEVLTYSYDSTGKRLLLTANNTSGTSVTQPILASNVTAFCLDYRSSLWQHATASQTTSCGQVLNGGTTWKDLDAKGTSSGVGNGNGLLDGPELRNVDSIVVYLTVLQGQRKQVYRTQIDLRNQG